MRNVLILSDDPERRAFLGRQAESAGLRPILLTGRERLLLESGDDESLDLVVYDLVEDSSEARRLERRFAGDELLEAVPVLRFDHAPDSAAVETDDPALHAVLRLPHDVSPEDLVARMRLGAEVGHLRRECRRAVLRDALTQTFHRRYLLHRLEAEFSRARRHRLPLSLVLLDIDRLREWNIRFGEDAGDAVIRRVGTLLREHVRREDILARTGEGSFGILMAGNRYRGAAVLANKVRTELEALSLPLPGTDRGVRVSAGVTSFPDNPVVGSAEDLLRAAEGALREAKARGGNRVHVDPGVLEASGHRVLLVDEDATLATLLEDLLAMDDLEVESVDAPPAALGALRERGADVLIVDLSTVAPHGVSRFLQDLSGVLAGRRLPLIGLARFDVVVPDEVGPAGFDRFLTKPFSVSVLRGLVRELLEAYALPATPK